MAPFFMPKKNRKEKRARPSSRLRISLCMIARNEAAFLEACLRSVQGLADEIVLVDTGSEDDTVAVAERFGARVLRAPWEDDFAAPRNASITAATGDWIFQMDCDEVIAARDLGAIRRAAVTGGCDGYLMTTRNYSREKNRARGVACRGDCAEEKGYEGWFPTTKVRLFRNDPRIRYRGAVHETVEQSILDAGGRIGECLAPVHHYGYVEKDRGPERYLAVAEKKAAQEPDNPKAFYELASVYGDLKRYDEAVHAVERTLSLVAADGLERHRGSHLEMEIVFNAYGSLLDGARRYDEAIRAHERALGVNPKSYQALNNIGSLYERKGDLAQALAHFERAHAFAPEVALIVENLERVKKRMGEWERGSAGAGPHPPPSQALRAEHPPPSLLLPLRSHPPPSLPYTGEGGGRGVGEGRTQPHPPILPAPDFLASREGGRLSLVMIVKNEEARLGRCLESVQGLVDEVVVVDTGSSDRTVEVAERYGAKVHYFTWCEDFSAARNESIRHATGDWLMWLDADDIFPKENFSKVRRAVRMGKRHAFYFRLQDEGYDATSCLQLRLFPNLPGVRFEMPVHEQVALSLGRLGLEIVPTEIVVRHTGYTTPEVVRAKQRRYFQIMQRWLEAHPDDYIVRHHEAHTHYVWGELDEAIADYRRILEEGRAAADRNLIIVTTAHLYVGRSLMRKGEYGAALPPLREALRMDDQYAVTHLTLGECYLRLDRIEEAFRHLRLTQKYEDQVTFAPNDPRKVRALVRLFLGQAHEAKGDLREAARHYEAAEAVGVPEVEALGPLSAALRKTGRKQEAQQALERAMARHADNPNHPFNLGVMALEDGDLDRAEGLFLRATETGEGVSQAFLNLGFIAKKRGAFDRAEAMYRQAAERMADGTEAQANLGHLYLSLKRWDAATEALRRVRGQQQALLDINLGLAVSAAHTGDAATVREMLGLVVRATYGAALAAGLPGDVSAPEMAQLFVEAGRMLLNQKQLACAALAYEAARALDPNLHSAALALAEVLRHQGETWRAIEVYEGLIQAAPGADLFRKLGACYRQLGSDAAAQACEAQAVAMAQAKGAR